MQEFSTSPITLGGFQEYELKGFLDATNLRVGEYKTNVTVYYSGEETTKVMPLTVISKGINENLIIIIGILAIITALVITFIVRKKKHEENDK